MTIMHEMADVLLVNTESLNKNSLGKQALELKEKIAFVLQMKIPILCKHGAVSLCLRTRAGSAPLGTQFCSGLELLSGRVPTLKSRAI